MIPRLPTTPDGLRVFYGYRRDGLSDPEFLESLANVFMPGTPLLLRDLGLAAYMPVVLPESRRAGLPDEVAIIGYASAEAYAHARRETVVGQMYTDSHRGVFDVEISRSQPPGPLRPPESGVTAFYCTGVACDWQADGEVMVWVGESAQDSDQFPGDVVDWLQAAVSRFADRGVVECVGQVGPDWVALWLLLDGFDAASALRVEDWLGQAPAAARELMRQKARRLIWRDGPPAAEPARPSAWSYVFERRPRYFLR